MSTHPPEIVALAKGFCKDLGVTGVDKSKGRFSLDYTCGMIAQCIAPLIARERAAALRASALRVFAEFDMEGDDAYAINDVITALEEYADAEEAKTKGEAKHG